MDSEYIKLTHPEILYGKKNLLYSQIGLLSMIKRHKTFRNIRKKELLLKITLKTNLDEAKKALQELEKKLPKTKISSEEEELKELSRKAKESIAIEKESSSINEELRRIRSKLAELSR